MKKKYRILYLSIALFCSLIPSNVFAHNLEQDRTSKVFQGVSTSTSTPTPTSTPTSTDTPTPTSTPTSTDTPTPTSTPTSTDTPTTIPPPTNVPVLQVPIQVAIATNYARPMISMINYSSMPNIPKPGEEFVLSMDIKTIGVSTGKYIQVSFLSENFIPLENGGLFSIPDLRAGASYTIIQKFILSPSTPEGINIISVDLKYGDVNGSPPFADKLSVAISVGSGAANNGVKLNIRSFSADPALLEPGSQFKLSMQIANIGEQKASDVTMIFGGGSLSGNGAGGSTANLSTFGLLNSSNIIPLGSIEPGVIVDFNQTVVVNNVNTAGAYPLNISFLYDGDKVLDQMIVLQVVMKPRIFVDFYDDYSAILNQNTNLPVRITNSRSSAIYIEKIEIHSPAWEVSPSVFQVGKIDGDDQWIPERLSGTSSQVGLTQLTIDIYYFDDFNQIQKISIDYPVEVEDEFLAIAVTPISNENDNGNDSFNSQSEIPETNFTKFMKYFLRIIRGLFGLDSSNPLAG